MKSEYNTLEFDYDRIREIKLKMNKEKQEKEAKEKKDLIKKQTKNNTNKTNSFLEEIVTKKFSEKLIGVSFTSDNKRIAITNDYNQLKIFSFENEQLNLVKEKRFKDNIYGVSYSPKNDYLAITGKYLTVYSNKNDTLKQIHKGSFSEPFSNKEVVSYGVCFGSNNKTFAITLTNDKFIEYNIISNKAYILKEKFLCSSSLGLVHNSKKYDLIYGHENFLKIRKKGEFKESYYTGLDVNGISLKHDDKFILYTCDFKTLNVLKEGNKKIIHVFEKEYNDYVRDLDISKNDEYLALNCGNELKIYKLNWGALDGKKIRVLKL